mmetsp:Transcript_20779/g.64925  ORF Transcript_20779/g.64925 Transcript_20779/m.64925 type:complete len:234 (-) Transcript_20779:650-1351(-)
MAGSDLGDLVQQSGPARQHLPEVPAAAAAAAGATRCGPRRAARPPSRGAGQGPVGRRVAAPRAGHTLCGDRGSPTARSPVRGPGLRSVRWAAALPRAEAPLAARHGGSVLRAALPRERGGVDVGGIRLLWEPLRRLRAAHAGAALPARAPASAADGRSSRPGAAGRDCHAPRPRGRALGRPLSLQGGGRPLRRVGGALRAQRRAQRREERRRAVPLYGMRGLLRALADGPGWE